MNDAELRELEVESQKPFMCPNKGCYYYKAKPICYNHAHVKCEDYAHERVASEFVENFRASEGFLEGEV